MTTPEKVLHPEQPTDGSANTTEKSQLKMITIQTAGHPATFLPLAGRTVREIRKYMTTPLNIGPDAAAMVAGKPADENTIVQEGQTVEFVHKAGAKG